MSLVITNKKEIYNLIPTTTIEELSQNINVILSTVKGSVALDRDFGIDISFIDNPTPRAIMKAKINISEAIKKYEPRVEVKKVIIDNTNGDLLNGDCVVKVEVEVLDEYK